jgi:putative NADPH-quinone reductase
MPSRIVIIQGHPDAARAHFCHALADHYAAGALAGGHEVRRIEVAGLGLPVLTAPDQWENEPPSDGVRACQENIAWARHLVIVYPLWLGAMPAMLKAFFEQVFRPGFALPKGASPMGKKLLKGRTARIVVTMGMPALMYRWYFGAHSLKSLKRSILGFCGIGPVRESLIGLVADGGEQKHRKWLETMRRLGRGAR